MMEFKRKPILKLEMFVKKNTTSREADKVDSFNTSLKSFAEFLIGNRAAKASLTIKAEDDVLHYNFPAEGEYIVEIYPKYVSEPNVVPATQQVPLADNEGKVNETFAEAPSSGEEVNTEEPQA